MDTFTLKLKRKKLHIFGTILGNCFSCNHTFTTASLLWLACCEEVGRLSLFFKSIAQFQQSIGSGRPWSQAQLQSWHISWSRCRSASTDSVVKAALACSSASRFATHLSSRHASVSYLLLLMPALFCMRVFLLLSLLYAFHICELKGGDTDFSAEPCHEKKHFCR